MIQSGVAALVKDSPSRVEFGATWTGRLEYHTPADCALSWIIRVALNPSNLPCWTTSTEDSPINEPPDQSNTRPTGNVIINVGAVIAVLLGIPSLFIGLFGAIGVVTGEKLVAGSFGAMWAYLATVGAYELNRRKFAWARGARYSDRHLLAGTVAASASLAISGAMNETMPALVIVPALSAIMQANHGHEKKYRALIHAVVLLTGVGIGAWFYTDGVIGKVLLDTVAAMP